MLYSLRESIIEGLNIPPAAIVKHFNPLPPIKTKEYIYYLLLKNIDPYSLFTSEEDKKYVEEIHMEIQPLLDDYRSYYELKVNKELGKEIFKTNSYLYSLLKRRNTKCGYITKIKLDSNVENDYYEIMKVKSKKFNEVI